MRRWRTVVARPLLQRLPLSRVGVAQRHQEPLPPRVLLLQRMTLPQVPGPSSSSKRSSSKQAGTVLGRLSEGRCMRRSQNGAGRGLGRGVAQRR